MAARDIQAYRLRTEIAVDASKGRRELQATEKDVGKVESRFRSMGKEISTSMKNAGFDSGKAFGRDFGSSATSVIVGSFKSLATTVGSIVGTAIAPGIGTAIGSTLGSAIDAGLDKAMGPIMDTIKKGIDLNEILESTRIEFKTFAGSEQEANKYLNELLDMSGKLGILPETLIEASEKTFDLTNNLKLTRTILKASADQAADFGGKVETFQAIADTLGLIAEKGELASRELNKLYKLGINAKARLSEATGLSEKKIEQMIKAGRVRGDVAARLIAESIEREKGGFAEKLASSTLGGQRRRNEALVQVRAAEGTEQASRGLKDFYTTANDVLDSPQARQFTQFINEKTGALINMVEKASRAGVNVAEGFGTGMAGPDGLRSVYSSFTSFGDSAIKFLKKDVFEIESPSKRTAREIGVPMGEGISVGMLEYAAEHADHDIEEFIRIYEQAAIEAQKRTGVPASVTMAQAILESRAGKSGLTRRANNFFGIKGRGPAGSVTMRTREETRGGASYNVNSDFRAYNTPEESFLDHANFLLGPRYRGALSSAGNPSEYARRIAGAGYATDTKYAQKVSGLINRYNLQTLDVGGSPVSDANPVPVRFAGAVGGASGSGPVRDLLGGASQIDWGKKEQDLSGYVVKLDDADGAVVDVAVNMGEAIKGLDMASDAMLPRIYGVVPAMRALTIAEAEHAKGSVELAKKYQEESARQLFIGVHRLDQLSSMIGEAAGFLPQQQVGKKRGLFSKILGVAAPFLSFIPGVGPILSMAAGMASNALGGNYAGVVSGLATGLQPGGVFRGSGGGSSGSPGTSVGGGILAAAGAGVRPRAGGGPVSRGRMYLVGEHRPEMFIPNSDGWIHPGGGGGAMMEVLEGLRREIANLQSMPPEHVVMKGARGYIKAMDRDAELIKLQGRRMRVA